MMCTFRDKTYKRRSALLPMGPVWAAVCELGQSHVLSVRPVPSPEPAT